MSSPRILAFMCCLSALLLRGKAIIIHPNVPDSKYVTDVATVPFFVSLGERGACGGTVVVGATNTKYSYIISAAHCFCNDNGRKRTGQMPVIFSDGSKV